MSSPDIASFYMDGRADMVGPVFEIDNPRLSEAGGEALAKQNPS